MIDPSKCDAGVFADGESIAALDACAVRAEAIVKSIAILSRQKVDWHYSGGHVNVLFVGDRARVRAATEAVAPAMGIRVEKRAGEQCRCGEQALHDACSLLCFFAPGEGLYRSAGSKP